MYFVCLSQASATRIAELEQEVAHTSATLTNYRRAMDRMEDRLKDVVSPFENSYDGENRFHGIDDLDALGEWVLVLDNQLSGC